MMTQYLPPNLLALFAPRESIPYLPPVQKLPFEKKTNGYSGVSSYLSQFEDKKYTPTVIKVETKIEKKERKKKEKAEQIAYKLEQGIALYDPHNNADPNSDAYKTLFIARLNYDTSESKLRREFETYGPIKKVNIIHDRVNGKPRGYAFIEYEHERDMHAAYKYADGKKIDGRRVLVDVERGRTVKGWLPRRLGGGLGGRRRGGPEDISRHSGRDENSNDRNRRDLSEERNVRDRNRSYRDDKRRERKRSISRDRKDRDDKRRRLSRS